MPRVPALLLMALLGVGSLIWAAPSHAGDPVLKLPDKYKKPPYSLMTLSVGFPNHGRLIRGIRLKPQPYLKIKPDSQKDNFGHPALVKMLKRTARDIAKAVPGSVMVVGDLSRQGGGKLAGHGSHQSGRDADVGFYIKDSKGKRVVPKRFIAFGADGKAKDFSGLRFDDWRNWLLVQSMLRDHRAGLSQIYISYKLRKRLLDFARAREDLRKYVPQAEKLLAQPLDSSPHDDHFHIRITCPKKQEEICREHSR